MENMWKDPVPLQRLTFFRSKRERKELELSWKRPIICGVPCIVYYNTLDVFVVVCCTNSASPCTTVQLEFKMRLEKNSLFCPRIREAKDTKT